MMCLRWTSFDAVTGVWSTEVHSSPVRHSVDEQITPGYRPEFCQKITAASYRVAVLHTAPGRRHSPSPWCSLGRRPSATRSPAAPVAVLHTCSPGIVTGIGFIAGAGYLIMSDTPLIEFLDRRWLVGLGLAAALGAAAGMWLRPGQGDGRRNLAGRLLQALTEAGLFLVLPVTAVWQAATRFGWTEPLLGHVAVVLVATIAGAAVAGAAWWRVHRCSVGRRLRGVRVGVGGARRCTGHRARRRAYPHGLPTSQPRS